MYEKMADPSGCAVKGMGLWQLAGIVGSNPYGSMDVCVLWMLCVVMSMSLHYANQFSRRVLPSVIFLSVIVKPH